MSPGGTTERELAEFIRPYETSLQAGVMQPSDKSLSCYHAPLRSNQQSEMCIEL